MELPQTDVLKSYEAIRRRSSEIIQDLCSQGPTARDLRCLIGGTEEIACRLINLPIFPSFRRNDLTAATTREFNGYRLALAYICKDSVHLNIEEPIIEPEATPFVKRLLDACRIWLTSHEMIAAYWFLVTHGISVPPLEINTDGDHISAIDVNNVGHLLIRAIDRNDLIPDVEDWEKTRSDKILVDNLEDAVRDRSGVHLRALAYYSHACKKIAEVQGWRSQLKLLTLKEITQELVRAHKDFKIAYTYRQARKFMKQNDEDLLAESSNVYQEVAKNSIKLTFMSVPPIFPVSTKSQSGYLVLPAALSLATSRLWFRFARGNRMNEMDGAANSMKQAASRDLARHQIKKLFPDFPMSGNKYFDDHRYIVGIEEKKKVLGVSVVLESGGSQEIDIYVIDMQEKRIAVGEVKFFNPCFYMWDFRDHFNKMTRPTNGTNGHHPLSQLDCKVDWFKKNLPCFELPDGTRPNESAWTVEGRLFINVFPEALWAIKQDCPEVAPVGSEYARRFLLGIA